ncbi:MAG: methyltransferase, FkbM family [Parcubacteria bacterium C7867-003]|nr:MAG: methyltransferase, FkbM family [Parcubacteria bacterium C7867-003]
MNKIINKILFIYKITSIGGDFFSKARLFKEILRIQAHFYLGGKNKPFDCLIQNNEQKVLVSFSGTLDEMHALIEIFIDRCYDPKVKKISKVLDLGANIGLATVWYSTEFPGCKIDSYEPNPTVYALLKKNTERLNGARAFNMAISNDNSSKTFYISNRSFSSSTHEIPNSKESVVVARSIDSAIENIGGNVDVIKIDIEGEEFTAIEQSKKIGEVNIILGESHPYKAGVERDTMKKILTKTHKTYSEEEKDKSIFYATKN